MTGAGVSYHPIDMVDEGENSNSKGNRKRNNQPLLFTVPSSNNGNGSGESGSTPNYSPGWPPPHFLLAPVMGDEEREQWETANSNSNNGDREGNIDRFPLPIPLTDFTVPHRDARGETVSITVKLQPGMFTAVEQIIASKLFPYQSPADFYRHHIFNGIRWCEHYRPESTGTGFSALVEAVNEISRASEQRRGLMESLDALDAEVQWYESRGWSSVGQDTLLRVWGKLRGAVIAAEQSGDHSSAVWSHWACSEFWGRFGDMTE